MKTIAFEPMLAVLGISSVEIVLILMAILVSLTVVALVVGFVFWRARGWPARRRNESTPPPQTPPVTRTKRLCQKCGGEMSADAPQGLCPACLMKVAIGSESGNPVPAGERKPAPAPADLAAHFPQLEILELLGQGGMGMVYKARQKQLERVVALKILPHATGRDPAFAERFSREAKALARLNHPNIVSVYDFGQADGLYYFIMEFVDGMNLRQLEKSRRLASPEALTIIPKICDALQYAHDEGFVHRDIKPENILLDKKGHVKIADFGLAKILGRAAKDFTLTDAHHVMGTPHYMAPEQVEHPLEVDHRADIYSLGVVFYEMLTGELPLGRFAPPSKKVQVDVRLDEIVLRALEKEPELRYQQASALKTEVETVAAIPPGSSRREEAQTEKTRVQGQQAEKSESLFTSATSGNLRAVLLMMALHAVVVLAITVCFVKVMPTFSDIFAGFGVSLSTGTALAFAISKVFQQWWPLLIPLVLGVDLTGCLMAQRYGGSRGRRSWSGIVGIGLFLILALSATTLFQTYLKLSDTVTHVAQPAGQGQFKDAAKERVAGGFGPVIERTINRVEARTNFLIRFKTGELRTPPSETASSHVAIHPWARSQGLDAGAGIINSNVLSGFDMAVLPAPAQCWEELTPAQAARRLDSLPLDTIRIMLYGASSLPETCVFKTREGGIGILQLIEHVLDPPGLKVRYKYLDKPPVVTQSDANTVVTRSWSPDLLPGEKPDVDKIRQEAGDLMKRGKYEDALQRHLWYHNHALEYGIGQSGVRLSFALADWVELGRRYPKAKQALIEIRDAKTQEFAEGRGYAELFQDIASINSYLQNTDATFEVFKSIQQRDVALAHQCYFYAQDLLVEKGEYELCFSYMGDPQRRFESSRSGWEMEKQMYQRQAEFRKQHPVPAGIPRPLDMTREADKRFVGNVRQLIEILVGSGHKADAETIQDQAVKLLNDSELKSAVSDAEEKTRHKLMQKSGIR